MTLDTSNWESGRANLRSEGQMSRLSRSPWEQKCKNLFLAHLPKKIVRFTSHRHQNDPRPIFVTFVCLSNTLHVTYTFCSHSILERRVESSYFIVRLGHFLHYSEWWIPVYQKSQKSRSLGTKIQKHSFPRIFSWKVDRFNRPTSSKYRNDLRSILHI